MQKKSLLENTRSPISVDVGGVKCSVENQYISNHDFLEVKFSVGNLSVRSNWSILKISSRRIQLYSSKYGCLGQVEKALDDQELSFS